MTMPTQMNCPHFPDGWCLECVQKLRKRNEQLSETLKNIANDIRQDRYYNLGNDCAETIELLLKQKE